MKLGRERLDNALEAVELLCEPVEPPKADIDYIRYFCGNTEIPEELKAREVQRNTLYKVTVSFIRAYANIADEMEAAGYNISQIEHIKSRMDHYIKLREIIRMASGEVIDLKAYEADMRHLIDNYIQADDSVVISPFGDMPLIDVIVKSGIAEAINNLPSGIKGSKEYIVVHELTHLLEPTHNERFVLLMERFMPNWKVYKDELNRLPVRHENWSY